MKRIYDFEQAAPPVLTEAMLRKRLEQKKLRRQAFLVSIGGALMQLCLLVLALALYAGYPLVSMATVCYVLVSTAGTGVLAVVFWKQRRYLTP